MADKAKTETKIFQVACSPQVHDTKQHTNGMMYDVLIAAGACSGNGTAGV